MLAFSTGELCSMTRDRTMDYYITRIQRQPNGTNPVGLHAMQEIRRVQEILNEFNHIVIDIHQREILLHAHEIERCCNRATNVLNIPIDYLLCACGMCLLYYSSTIAIILMIFKVA